MSLKYSVANTRTKEQVEYEYNAARGNLAYTWHQRNQSRLTDRLYRQQRPLHLAAVKAWRERLREIEKGAA